MAFISATQGLYDESYDNLVKRWKDVKLTDSTLILLMKEIDIKSLDVVLKQAKLESGHFKSKLFKQGNNIFGMRKPKRRNTTALDKTVQGYATYKSWVYSVIDYKLWQEKREVKGNYYDYLKKRGYASNPSYFKLLKGIKIKNNILKLIDDE